MDINDGAGLPSAWTKLCNLFYVFFIYLWFLFLYVSSTVIHKDSMFKSFRFYRLACSWFMINYVK